MGSFAKFANCGGWVARGVVGRLQADRNERSIGLLWKSKWVRLVSLHSRRIGLAGSMVGDPFAFILSMAQGLNSNRPASGD